MPGHLGIPYQQSVERLASDRERIDHRCNPQQYPFFTQSDFVATSPQLIVSRDRSAYAFLVFDERIVHLLPHDTANAS